MKYTFLVFILSLTIIGIGCSKQSTIGGENQSPLVPKSVIELSEVADTKCLNVERYFAAIYSLYPSPMIRMITTQVSLASDAPVSHNFSLRMAALNFAFSDSLRNAIIQNKSAIQKDCTMVTLKTAGGTTEDFAITEFSPDHIRFENKNSERYYIQWLSSQNFKMDHSFRTGNYLCGRDLNVYLKVEKFYSWDSSFLAQTEVPSNLISMDYLKLVSEARGSTMDESSPITTSLLQSLRDQPIKTDLKICAP